MWSPRGQSQRSAFSHFSQDGLRKGEGQSGRPGGGGEKGKGGRGRGEVGGVKGERITKGRRARERDGRYR